MVLLKNSPCCRNVNANDLDKRFYACCEVLLSKPAKVLLVGHRVTSVRKSHFYVLRGHVLKIYCQFTVQSLNHPPTLHCAPVAVNVYEYGRQQKL